MAKTPFGWARLWAITRAIIGVAVAGLGVFASFWLGNALRRRIRANRGGDSSGPGSAKQVERENTSASKALDNALDILRRARSRPNP